MPCIHKFLNNRNYLNLIPSWDCKILIIGTFNPENDFHKKNDAKFYYQRNRNYFWTVFPMLFNFQSIDKKDTEHQIEFLKKYKVGITDLLISIDDAKIDNLEHKLLISSVKDSDIEKFNDFTWNTEEIINFIKESKIKAVFFTKIGLPKKVKISLNTFENQMRLIEFYCNSNNIFNRRLHTPTAMGLGKGNRVETLYSRWIEIIGDLNFTKLSNCK